jgi:ABC-type transport system substrate-binding protein
MVFERNPDYWDLKNGPYFDKIEMPFVLEAAQGVAQLKAGNLYTYSVGQDTIVSVKREVPDLRLYINRTAAFSPGNSIQFGTLPTEANKPFKDERVRQAFQMAIDRDLYIDVFNNVDKFRAEGIELGTYWHTALGPAHGWRLDPKDEKTFGPNAQYSATTLRKRRSSWQPPAIRTASTSSPVSSPGASWAPTSRGPSRCARTCCARSACGRRSI